MNIAKNTQSIFSSLGRKIRKFLSYLSPSLENKYINALFLLMLFSAIIHLLILFYIAITTKDLYVLNYFHILEITYFLPSLASNITGNIISIFFVVLFYMVILKINFKNEI